jgi:hypothetical protein
MPTPGSTPEVGLPASRSASAGVITFANSTPPTASIRPQHEYQLLSIGENGLTELWGYPDEEDLVDDTLQPSEYDPGINEEDEANDTMTDKYAEQPMLDEDAIIKSWKVTTKTTRKAKSTSSTGANSVPVRGKKEG